MPGKPLHPAALKIAEFFRHHQGYKPIRVIAKETGLRRDRLYRIVMGRIQHLSEKEILALSESFKTNPDELRQIATVRPQLRSVTLVLPVGQVK